MSRKIRLRRERLFAEHDGLCYWCGIKTIMPPRHVHNFPPTDNLATVDHLRTRLEHSRQDPNFTNEERTVLACWKCNNWRGILSQKLAVELVVTTIDGRHTIREESIRKPSKPSEETDENQPDLKT